MFNHGVWVPILLLAGVVGCSGRSPDASVTAEAGTGMTRGERLFDGNCIACHQHDARGIPGVYPSLVGSPVLLGDPAELARWVVQGQRPRSLPSGRYPTTMRQFNWMKAPDAAELFTYLRSHFGNAGAPVDVSTVAAALDPS